MELLIPLYAIGIYLFAGLLVTVVSWFVPYGQEPSWSTFFAWPVHLVSGVLGFLAWLVS